MLLARYAPISMAPWDLHAPGWTSLAAAPEVAAQRMVADAHAA
jgi:hypothetical protein